MAMVMVLTVTLVAVASSETVRGSPVPMASRVCISVTVTELWVAARRDCSSTLRISLKVSTSRVFRVSSCLSMSVPPFLILPCSGKSRRLKVRGSEPTPPQPAEVKEFLGPNEGSQQGGRSRHAVAWQVRPTPLWALALPKIGGCLLPLTLYVGDIRRGRVQPGV